MKMIKQLSLTRDEDDLVFVCIFEKRRSRFKGSDYIFIDPYSYIRNNRHNFTDYQYNNNQGDSNVNSEEISTTRNQRP